MSFISVSLPHTHIIIKYNGPGIFVDPDSEFLLVLNMLLDICWKLVRELVEIISNVPITFDLCW